ncbi:hypothetical protein [Kineococcus sp. G2]|uniref:hypothetical protein n=1 Tax=Kineococcus sp. G2 TaxID=3127484 RepID=UPI00301BE4B6
MTTTTPERRGPLRLTLQEARARYRGGPVEYRDHQVREDVDGFPVVEAGTPVHALIAWTPEVLGWPVEDLEVDDDQEVTR